MKPTTEIIIQSLRYCAGGNGCLKCPYDKTVDMSGCRQLRLDAAEALESLQKERESQQHKINLLESQTEKRKDNHQSYKKRLQKQLELLSERSPFSNESELPGITHAMIALAREIENWREESLCIDPASGITHANARN